MKTNLLSLGQLLEKGYVMNMEHNMMKVYDNMRKLILKAPLLKNRTFKIGIQIGETLTSKIWAFKFQEPESTKKERDGLWFSLYRPTKGQINQKFFQVQHANNKKELLKVVYSNVCGPMESILLGEEAFEVFKRFKAMVEKQCGQSIKILRTNGGGEYTSHDFHSYCNKGWIIHEVTTHYTLQHNRKVERRNKILMNMARSISTITYILNRSPTKSLNDVTLEEVFGSLYFKHVPNERRKKLGNKKQLMIFLGYDSTNAYKL
ncbi:hypothetical protein CR513_00446, partial [Mucuna pruriens]